MFSLWLQEQGGMPGDLRLLWEQGLAPRTFLGAFDKSAVTAFSEIWEAALARCPRCRGGVGSSPLCLHNPLEFSPGTRSRMLTAKSWNPSMVWVGRGFKAHPVPPHSHGQGHLPLNRDGPSPTEPGLEHFMASHHSSIT